MLLKKITQKKWNEMKLALHSLYNIGREKKVVKNIINQIHIRIDRSKHIERERGVRKNTTIIKAKIVD